MDELVALRRTNSSVDGLSPRARQRAAKAGTLLRLKPGEYVLADPKRSPRAEWLLRLDACLRRAPEGSAVSHRAAALLHGLEGFTEFALDISVPTTSGWRAKPAIRCGWIDERDAVFLHGLRTTSLERTLADLGRFVGVDQLEFAVEHALRGFDRRRPDVWNEPLLTNLAARAEMPRLRGGSVLRAVLTRRGRERPCGSFAETTLLQGLRAAGVTMTRQPTINVRVGQKRRRTYFPDFADLERGVLVEVDGKSAHDGDDRWDRDDVRQNELSRGFTVLRFHARRVLANPLAVASEVASVQCVHEARPPAWRAKGVRVTVSSDGVVALDY